MRQDVSYYTYIVHCIDGTFYTGLTNNIGRRLRQHNGIIKGGAKYTIQRKPVILFYAELHPTHAIAAQRERKIKQLTHKQKEKLCNVIPITQQT
jgi:putative endonuclease